MGILILIFAKDDHSTCLEHHINNDNAKEMSLKSQENNY